jgi:hypothetical protein
MHVILQMHIKLPFYGTILEVFAHSPALCPKFGQCTQAVSVVLALSCITGEHANINLKGAINMNALPSRRTVIAERHYGALPTVVVITRQLTEQLRPPSGGRTRHMPPLGKFNSARDLSTTHGDRCSYYR